MNTRILVKMIIWGMIKGKTSVIYNCHIGPRPEYPVIYSILTPLKPWLSEFSRARFYELTSNMQSSGNNLSNHCQNLVFSLYIFYTFSCGHLGADQSLSLRLEIKSDLFICTTVQEIEILFWILQASCF